MTTSRLTPTTSSRSANLMPCDRSRTLAGDLYQRSPATRRDRGGYNFLGLFINLLACFIMFRLVGDVFCLQTLKNRYGTVTVISAKPCQNALGQFGTCMFMWDCIKSEGVHLGTCSDRFLFGSCCYHNASLVNPNEPSNQFDQRPTNTTTTTTTKSNQLSGVLQSGGGSPSEESHSRPQSSGEKFLSRPTSSAATEAPSQVPTAATADISIVKPTNPDRLFLSSQSPPPSDNLDYVTTSSAGNSSSGDHVVSLNKNDLRPSQHQQQASSNKNQLVADASSSSIQSEATTTFAALKPTTTTMTTLNSSISQLSQPIQAVGPGVSIGQQPMTSPQQSGDTNQVLAYQLVSPPSVPHTTQSPPPELAQQPQTQRPASWLSRPSLLANAIFHSFKPYLSPNRQRPTYRPYIGTGGGFRPQQMRPTILNSPHPQRPYHMFAPINNNQHQSSPSYVHANQMHTQAANDSSSQNSTTTIQQDNNDHHIVNPSSMTDRRRPVDNGRPANGVSSNGDKLQESGAQHEMLGGAQQQNAASSSDSVIKVTPDYSLAQNNASSLAAASAGSVAQLGGYLIDLSNANKTLGVQQASSPQVPSPIYDYNSSQAHGYALANNTLGQYQQQTAAAAAVANNASGLLSYPLINPALGTSPIPDVVGPIDEIYGLIDGNQHQQDSQQVAATAGAVLEIGQTTASSAIVSGGGGGGDQQRPPPPPLQQTSMILGASQFSEPQTSPPSPGNSSAWIMPATSVPPPPTTATTAATTNTVASTSGSATTTVAPASPVRQALGQQQHHRVPQSSGPSGSVREATCGVTGLYPQTKVVGGKNAAFGAWPWQVSVRKVSFFGFSSMHRCGGAVISSEWIATAGHCVQDLALQSIRIRVGEYDFETITEPYPHLERNARKKIVHPDYNTYTYENDLALIQLDQPLQFSTHVAPICLPPDNIDLVGRNATVTGWGRLNEGGSLPSILQEVIVPIVSNDKCRDMFLRAGRPEYIPDIFLCAGYEEGGRDSCQGDSGGPLQVRGDDGRWMLAGIISWGIGCAEPLLVGVCSAIQRFKPWITATISAG